jgi:type II secretory pathway pseudopilin PulG
MVRKQRRKDRSSERGWSLLEAVIAAGIVAVAAAVALHALAIQSAAPEMEERVRRANDAADTALDTLSARLTQIGSVGTAGGGSFTVGTDNTIVIKSACSNTLCDKWMVDSNGQPINTGTSSAGGTPFTAIEAAGTRREFVRRWRVSLIAGRPNLREITVAVLDSDTSTEPVVMQTTRAAIRTP